LLATVGVFAMPDRGGNDRALGGSPLSLGTDRRPLVTRSRRNYRDARILLRRVAGDILRISGAVGLAHVASLAAAPLITRLYGPEAFGHFALFNAIATIVTPLASLRYEWALPLPTEEATAHDLLALCLLSVVVSSVTLAALGLVFWPAIADWSGGGIEIVAFLPFAIALMGLHAVLRNWLVRHQVFSQVAHMRLATIVGAVLCQLGLGLYFAGTIGLILGMIGGYAVGLLLASYHCRQALAQSVASMRLARIRDVAAEYRRFAIVTAPSGVVNAIGSQLPSMVFPALYGLAVTGQLSLARQVLAQPLALIGQAANEVLWGNAARLLVDDPGRLWPLFLRLNCCLLAVMVPGFILTWFGAELFAFVFGPGWEQAGSFAGVMIFASFFGLAAQGTTSLHVYRLNHWMCAWEFIQLALMLAMLGAAMRLSWSPMTCIIGLTAANAVAHVVLLTLNAVAVRRAGLIQAPAAGT
jgi:lipopolysaccharide exporter